MSDLLNKDFMSISIPVIKKLNSSLPFDIYLKRAEKAYTKLFKAGAPIDHERLDTYWKKKNVESLFVSRDNYRDYLSVVTSVATQYITQENAFTTEELISVTQEMINVTMLDVFIDIEVNQAAVSHATTAVQGCIKSFEKNPKTMIALFQHLTKHPYLMKHSVTTAVFSVIIAKEAGLTNEGRLLTLALGALLHDIGLSQVAGSLEEKNQVDLTPKEWKELKEHPQIGKRMLDGLKGVPDEVSLIVLQHHEQPNGRGYPNGLYDNKLFNRSLI